jgi:prepilin-type N-terminal cleavage/methylation domain-containing protein
MAVCQKLPEEATTYSEARCEMEMTPTRRSDREAGFTLIDMLFVIAILGLLASMAIPGLMRARGAAQASSALGTMRVVNSAELTFAISCGLGFYSPDFPTLGVAPVNNPEGFLPPELSSGFTFEKSGYLFSLAGTPLAGAPASCNGLAAGMASPGYAVVADPLDSSGSVGRYFGSNADGLIYQDNATLSTTMPENGGPPSGAPIQ